MTMTYQTVDMILEEYFGEDATPHLLLHIGNPGASGTGNIAQKPDEGGNIDRKPVSFGPISNHPTQSERRVLSNVLVAWSGSEIAAGQEITHATIWSAQIVGTLHICSALSTPKIVGSDGVTVASGEVEIAMSVFMKP